MFVKKASAIIAVSAFTAEEVESCFPGSSRKTIVVHEAAPPEYSMVTDSQRLERTREKLNLPSRFVLFLGTLEPRKNLPRLLEAFAGICDKIPHKLVLSGPVGWKSSELEAKLHDPRIADRVQLTGFVDAEDIPPLLSLAEIFVYPSLYEGFGLPVLEAMACGTPVITSTTSSLPEVAGDAALLVDPESSSAISGALVRLARDEDLRDELKELGLQRSRKFSWTRAAGETLDVYRRIIPAGDNK
ncbi:MAG: glycosyltransferase [Candidatus Aegiribacteria sp.]|nr:glycosyltransferase [Candidatus Aegiribacteria sp.]MBD3294724.1 glycosyltransferase [Candidatus Fermentibacteria bacterium]